jgi:hypothetical protein
MRFDAHLIHQALSNMHTKDTPGYEVTRQAAMRPTRPIGVAAIDAA